jgi:hypothetical protein
MGKETPINTDYQNRFKKEYTGLTLLVVSILRSPVNKPNRLKGENTDGERVQKKKTQSVLFIIV